MHENVVLACVAAFTQFINALLGYKVSMEPVTKWRWLYHVAFVVVGLVGVGSVGLLAYRGSRSERAHFSLRTATTITPDPFVVNRPLAFNVMYNNVGNGVAYNFVAGGITVLEPDESVESQKDAVSRFQPVASGFPPAGITSVPPNQPGFFTAFGPLASPEDIDNLKNGRRIAMMVALLKYQDDFGSHVKQACYLLQPPQEGNIFIFRACNIYNEVH